MGVGRVSTAQTLTRGWAPYALLGAGVYLVLFVFAAVGGSGTYTSSVVPIRQPGDPVVDIQTAPLFLHNLWIVLKLAGGALLGGLFTVYGLMLNGFIHGSAFQGAITNLGLGKAVMLLIPHGVLELPALWLGAALSFRWVHYVWKVASGNRDRTTLPGLLLGSLAVLCLTVGMLFVAAVIEANVTVTLA